MQVYLGSYYINDFNQFGRTFRVIAQADQRYRGRPDDVPLLKTRNADGEMVPLGRSEEHTSELQSLMRISSAVFCLKKKKTPSKDSKANISTLQTYRSHRSSR